MRLIGRTRFDECKHPGRASLVGSRVANYRALFWLPDAFEPLPDRGGGNRTHDSQGMSLPPHQLGFATIGAPPAIRTLTVHVLSVFPLPVGVEGHDLGVRCLTPAACVCN